MAAAPRAAAAALLPFPRARAARRDDERFAHTSAMSTSANRSSVGMAKRSAPTTYFPPTLTRNTPPRAENGEEIGTDDVLPPPSQLIRRGQADRGLALAAWTRHDLVDPLIQPEAQITHLASTDHVLRDGPGGGEELIGPHVPRLGSHHTAMWDGFYVGWLPRFDRTGGGRPRRQPQAARVGRGGAWM